MKISLIGMSGSGKSYWSKKLAENGFKMFCVDDLVERKLEPELKIMGFAGIAEVAKWMGQPYDWQYFFTSRKYLGAEIRAMNEILDDVAKLSDQENIVLDTTGSVIYTGEAVLDRLKKLTKVIYLETPQMIQDEMYKLYLQDPKPVIWGRAFKKRLGEEDLEALTRCYPDLLKFRLEEYEKLANLKIDYKIARQQSIDIRSFIKEIEK